METRGYINQKDTYDLSDLEYLKTNHNTESYIGLHPILESIGGICSELHNLNNNESLITFNQLIQSELKYWHRYNQENYLIVPLTLLTIRQFPKFKKSLSLSLVYSIQEYLISELKKKDLPKEIKTPLLKIISREVKEILFEDKSGNPLVTGYIRDEATLYLHSTFFSIENLIVTLVRELNHINPRASSIRKKGSNNLALLSEEEWLYFSYQEEFREKYWTLVFQNIWRDQEINSIDKEDLFFQVILQTQSRNQKQHKALEQFVKIYNKMNPSERHAILNKWIQLAD